MNTPKLPEPVAYFFRFHTDDSLAGKPNVRSWQLCEGQPVKGLEKEGELRLLYAAESQMLALHAQGVKEERDRINELLQQHCNLDIETLEHLERMRQP